MFLFSAVAPDVARQVQIMNDVSFIKYLLICIVLICFFQFLIFKRRR